MKATKIFLIFIGIILLIGLSDFIYLYRNEPSKVGKVYLYFALKEAKKGDLEKTLQYLDKTASFHLKQNRIIYKDKYFAKKIKNNRSGLSLKTKKEINDYLLKTLPVALQKNSSPLISNIYYNLGLIAYQNNFHIEASNFFLTSTYLDPELGHLYIELANSYLNDGNFEKGHNILEKCQQFNWPKKQCQEYLELNVKSNTFLPVGSYKEAIYKLQREYF